MKKLILLAGVASLAACADTAVEEEAPADDVAMEAEAEAPTAPDGGPVPGTYSIRDMDGNETNRLVVNDDMTYNRTIAESGETVTGVMSFNDEGQVCFDPDGDPEPVCYPGGEGANEDGSWTSYNPDGSESGTVIRVEG